MHVLVIGSSGFLGSFVVDALRSAGHSAAGLDLVASPWSDSTPTDICDVRELEMLRTAIRRQSPDAVMNLSGVLGTQETFLMPQETVAVNVIGAINVLDCCREMNLPYIGVQTGTPWLSPYAISKRSATEFVQAYHVTHGVRAAVLRIFNAYGPRQDGVGKVEKIVPRFIYNAINDHPLPIFGSGEQVIDLIHAEDCAEAFVRTLDRAPMCGEVIDVGCGRATKVTDVAEAVIRLVGRGTMQNKQRRMGEGLEYPVADIRSCRDLLGFVPDPSLDRLPATVEWYRHHYGKSAKSTNMR